MKVRRGEEVRKSEILAAALELAHEIGYQKITRDALALKALCSTGLITTYFGTMNHLRRAIISHAIAKHDLQVIAQGLTANEAKAHHASEELKRAAMEHTLLMGQE